MSNTAKIKSLEKAINLLDLFDSSNPTRGITEVSEISGMSKSSVYKIFYTMSQLGLLMKDDKTGRYRLGYKIVQLHRNFQHTNDFIDMVNPFLRDLANKCNEAVYLAIRDQDSALYVANAFPDSRISGRSVVGIRVSMHCTAVGKCLLAYDDPEKVESLFQYRHEIYTENTITDWDKLKKELATVKSNGYAIDNMEHEYGIKCVAVPLLDKEGAIYAAISISGPSLRFDDAMIESTVGKLFDVSIQIGAFL